MDINSTDIKNNQGLTENITSIINFWTKQEIIK